MVHAFDRCLMPPPAAAPRRPPAASSQPWLLQVFRATLSVLRIKNSMGAVQVRRALPTATCKYRRPIPVRTRRSHVPRCRSRARSAKGGSSAPAAKRKQRGGGRG